MSKKIKASEICGWFNIELCGADVEIDGLGFCDRDTEFTSILSYATSDKYIESVAKNPAVACLVISPELEECYSEAEIGRRISLIISAEPEMAFYRIHEELCRTGKLYDRYDFEKRIGNDCNIAPSAVIEHGVIIGNHVTIGPNTVVRRGSVIEDNTTIGCNATIGSEGFQMIRDTDGSLLHPTHVGRCHICSDVYIGDHSCICNSLFGGETYIGQGTKINNLVHIAHNCYVGKKVVITAHVMLCGSVKIEDNAWIAPNTSILNRVVIGTGAKVGLASVVTRNVAPHSVVYGSPAKVHEKSK